MNQTVENEKYIPEKKYSRLLSGKRRIRTSENSPHETKMYSSITDEENGLEWVKPGQLIPDTMVNTLGSILL